MTIAAVELTTCSHRIPDPLSPAHSGNLPILDCGFWIAGHRITRLALAKTMGEIVNPICSTVLRLTTNSNFVGCWTGKCGLGLFAIFSFQCFDVGQVLRSGGGEFVLNQVFSGEHGDRLIGEFGTHPVCPSFFELDTVDRGQDIDLYRFYADLEYEAGCRKVFLR
jgi:hypothetical protein